MEPLGRVGAACLAAAALVYNTLVAPGFGLDRSYRRKNESIWGGLTTYPLAVLLLVLVTPAAVAAGAWAVLAAADPSAAAFGSRYPRPAVPGNPRKSLVGSAAGFVAGTVICYAVLGSMGADHALPAAVSAGAAGAVVEALPIPGDDNLRIAAAAALALLPWLA